MARLKNPIQPEHLELLRTRIRETLGKPIDRSADAETASKDIEQKLGHKVSPQTIRRIFGFIESPFSPSKTILNILALYCGYSDWADLVNTPAEAGFKPLSLKGEALLYLKFFRIQVEKEADVNYHHACAAIVERIVFNPSLYHMLAAPLAENPGSQEFFYERFPVVDELNPRYLRGIRFYLRHKKAGEAQVFGYSLIALGAFLRKDKKGMSQALARLNQHKLQPGFHPFVMARHIGSNLLHKKLTKQNLDAELALAFQYKDAFPCCSRMHPWIFPYYQFMMADYLNLAGLYDTAALVLRSVNCGDKSCIMERGYLVALEVMERIANSPKDEQAYARWHREFTGWNELSFTFRKYYQLQALCALLKLQRLQPKQKASALQQLQQLVAETGYTWFDS